MKIAQTKISVLAVLFLFLCMPQIWADPQAPASDPSSIPTPTQPPPASDPATAPPHPAPFAPQLASTQPSNEPLSQPSPTTSDFDQAFAALAGDLSLLQKRPVDHADGSRSYTFVSQDNPNGSPLVVVVINMPDLNPDGTQAGIVHQIRDLRTSQAGPQITTFNVDGSLYGQPPPAPAPAEGFAGAEEQLPFLHEALSAVEEAIERYRELIAETEAEIDATREEIAEIHAEIDNLPFTVAQQRADLQNDLDDTLGELRALRKIGEELQLQIEQKSESDTAGPLRDELAKIQKQIEALELRKSGLQEALVNLSVEAERERLMARLAELEARLSEQKATLLRQQGRLSEYIAERDRLIAKIESLWSEIQS